jgi:formiminoglutamate deiminase
VRLSEVPAEPGEDTRRWLADAVWMGGSELNENVLIETVGGRISGIESGSVAPNTVRLHGVVLPGLVNSHSHAFHRLLRGRTHRQGGDFWLWREQMYRYAGSLTPESYEEVATAVYMEMALAGVTTVGEFHYLHHQSGGVPFTDANEMGHALIRAARAAGIRIALLDAGYFAAGFGDAPLDDIQTRFSDVTAERWLERVDALISRYRDDPDVSIGIAPHSVRAVPEAVMVAVAGWHDGKIPIHVHVSEQPAENLVCLEATTLTPTGVLDRVGLLGPATTLVHATHVTDRDIDIIARSGATVCYCATTERDLADGLGPSAELAAAGVPLAVGSDSHAVIDLFEETRGIELHARLAGGRRGVFAPEALLAAATTAGSSSLGFGGNGLEVGSPADFVVIDPETPRLRGVLGDDGIAGVLFAATAADVSDVFVAGRQVVDHGEHPGWERARVALDGPGP